MYPSIDETAGRPFLAQADKNSAHALGCTMWETPIKKKQMTANFSTAISIPSF
jgi:hypothetical protein